jgi:hypothetical protein
VRGLLNRLWIKSAQSTSLRVPSAASNSFLQVDGDKEIRQGEILKNIRYHFFEQNQTDPNLTDVSSYQLSYAVVATPDCDLLQDFKARKTNQSGSLFSVLLFGAGDSDNAKQRTGFGSKIWKGVLQNQMDQFHFLDRKGMASKSMEDTAQGLAVDFKRYFTLSPQELYGQFRNSETSSRCERLCRLDDLWREDFQRRAMSYMQRVALPDPDDDREP